MYNYIIILLLSLAPLSAWSQNEEIYRYENLVYYNSSIKEYLQYMKENTDDAEILGLIASMEKTNELIQEKLNNIVLPEMAEEVPDFVDEDIAENAEEDADMFASPEDTMPGTDDEDFESFGMNKFIPFKNKLNTNFEIQVGINNLVKNSVAAGLNEPEVYTPSSWYWDFAILTKNRLGGKKSKVALSYGFSYLINRFSMDNDVRLTVVNDQPVFTEVINPKKNPKLNVGYITIPLAFDVKLSKRFQFSIGGFAGYRVHTVQKLESKPDYERIEEQRYANYKLNNWLYGAKVSLGLKRFNIVGRYCFNNLFRENDHYDFNTFMIGTAFRL